MSETQENSSTTTKTVMTRSIRYLASLLRGIAGVLLYLDLRYGSAEFYAQIVTESTPLSARDTMPTTPLNKSSETSPKPTDFTYSNAHEFLNDIVNQRIPVSAVSLEQYLLAVLVATMDSDTPKTEFLISLNGNLFTMFHDVKAITYANNATAIQGAVH
jgi:hypothetical protein